MLPYRDHPEVRIRLEELEDRTLSRFAARSVDASGRRWPQEDDPLRTAYQRDRDRVIHCKAFRRLKHKTQVFIAPKGDHYRTRLTHTMEVTQVARTIARALRLNEDLTEATGLAPEGGGSGGGRVPGDDVVRRSYSVLVNGSFSDIDDGVPSDDAQHDIDVFPFLADPQ